MRVFLGFLAMLSMSQPAMACAMDGMFGGAHRFNPFLAMQAGSGDLSVNQNDDLYDSQDDYSDNADGSEMEDTGQEPAEDNPLDL
ncbi:hypothetical protein SAMN02745824_1936 [Parasphingorhabdus marina DSM 22363]|uniref:Uncharacterized protein n=1 Tax=Parasphingorhabdus marina DSM 22363 TaxID=1123272 RepID=A0A1N6EI99_9SPHN|nr:hypothetical protein [Parasphingorhabdus marina]SIN82748.1 hypothetical protein SAMN02745824_1936 [Parasphingorhabdus marina DSM 22363]